MQRPRNRQGRPPHQHDRGRGRRGGSHGMSDRTPSSVPSAQQVTPGAFVSIVLKIDQPTGREVQGVVADVLTKGNHPRGIKVRLVDGRVGRVQKMTTEEVAKAGSDGLSGLGRNGETGHQKAPASHSRSTHRYRDVREEEEMELPPTGRSLGSFLPPDHPLQDKQGIPQVGLDTSHSMRMCPVCEEFEGDEAAVSRHVADHFD